MLDFEQLEVPVPLLACAGVAFVALVARGRRRLRASQAPVEDVESPKVDKEEPKKRASCKSD